MRAKFSLVTPGIRGGVGHAVYTATATRPTTKIAADRMRRRRVMASL
jgi:hypothetical protein